MHLDADFVRRWRECYVTEELGDSALEYELLSTTHEAIVARGHLTDNELKQIVTWKSPRALGVLVL